MADSPNVDGRSEAKSDLADEAAADFIAWCGIGKFDFAIEDPATFDKPVVASGVHLEAAENSVIFDFKLSL